jgi:hypothetical protein
MLGSKPKTAELSYTSALLHSQWADGAEAFCTLNNFNFHNNTPSVSTHGVVSLRLLTYSTLLCLYKLKNRIIRSVDWVDFLHL